MAFYNPYAEFAKINLDPLKIDNQAIYDRFNARLKQETAARNAPMQQQGGNNWAGALAGAVGQIGAGMSTASNNPYDFRVNNLAPLTGAAQGFAQAGPIGAVIGGISGVFQRRQSYKRVQDNIEAIDPGVDLMDTDPITGKPMFNSASAIDATAKMSALNKGIKRRRKGLGKLFRSNDDIVQQHQMGVKAEQINQSLQSGRDQFNQATVDYNNQQSAMAQYGRLMNNNNRLRNLYSIGTKLY